MNINILSKPWIVIVSSLLLLTAACNDDSGSNFTDFPVVEAYLLPGDSVAVKISRQFPFLTDVVYSADDIENLSLTLTMQGSALPLTPGDSGWYYGYVPGLGEGDSLWLSFSFDERPVTAFTFIPSKPANLAQTAAKMYVPRMDSTSGPGSMGSMSDPVSITWDNEEASYYMVVVENIEETLDPIRDFGDEEPPGNRFRKSPTTSATEMIRPFDFEYFGRHRVIVFHVLPDYATLYEQSSNSSLNLRNPSTSITNGYGIFTGLNSDTLYINVVESTSK